MPGLYNQDMTFDDAFAQYEEWLTTLSIEMASSPGEVTERERELLSQLQDLGESEDLTEDDLEN
jgi:hypothetical protein